jgi:Rap/ran-GAP
MGSEWSYCPCGDDPGIVDGLEITPLLQRRTPRTPIRSESSEGEKNSLLIRPSPSYWIEGNKSAFDPREPSLCPFWCQSFPTTREYEEIPIVTSRYQDLFLRNPHLEILGSSEELGQVCISCLVKSLGEDPETKTTKGMIYTIVRWSRSDEYFETPLDDVTSVFSLTSSLPVFGSSAGPLGQVISGSALSGSSVFKKIQRSCPELKLLTIDQIVTEQHPHWDKIVDKLAKLENDLSMASLKVGVIYCRDDQTSEREMYGNTDVSENFLQFMSLLGEKFAVPSEKAESYTGGLHEGQIGFHTDWGGTKFVFHVSPYLEGDDTGQQIIRKKHIGNDTVVVIFVDGGQEISPEIFVSKVSVVFIFVRLSEGNNYHVQVVGKAEVHSFEPEVEDDPAFSFEPNVFFRNFLFQKIVNAHTAAFRSKLYKHYWNARQFQLAQAIKEI